MTYSDIIESNVIKYDPEWPKYAFHMTSISNFVSILSSGSLYSRNYATALNILKTDNASQDVIDNTEEQIKDYVRFYFRPKTPTYYHWEGYHQEGVRYNNEKGVNITLPILLLFDLESLLMDSRTLFNGTKASGNIRNVNFKQGCQAFSELKFEKIYHDGSTGLDGSIINYRHAEILYPQEYRIEQSLKWIVCRNSSDVITIKQVLREYDEALLEKWQARIKAKRRYFDFCGLRIEEKPIMAQHDTIQIGFELLGQSAYQKYAKFVTRQSSINHLPELGIIAEMSFDNQGSNYRYTVKHNLEKPNTYLETVMVPDGASKFNLRVYFDDRSNLVFCGSLKLKSRVKRISLEMDCTGPELLFPKK